MTGNRRGPDDWQSDNLVLRRGLAPPRALVDAFFADPPAVRMADAGFAWDDAKSALRLVLDPEDPEIKAYWTRVREEMRLHLADLKREQAGKRHQRGILDNG